MFSFITCFLANLFYYSLLFFLLIYFITLSYFFCWFISLFFLILLVFYEIQSNIILFKFIHSSISNFLWVSECLTQWIITCFDVSLLCLQKQLKKRKSDIFFLYKKAVSSVLSDHNWIAMKLQILNSLLCSLSILQVSSVVSISF